MPNMVKDSHLNEINEKIHDWEEGARSFLEKYDEIADAARVIAPSRKGTDSQLTDTRVAETIRAVEAITTLIFRMLTSSDPNFDVLPFRREANQDSTFAISTLLQWQQMKLSYRRNLLRAIRSLVTFGTAIAEEPWTILGDRTMPFASGTDFVPRSLLQIAFDTSVIDIEDSDWIATIDFVSPQRLRQLARKNPTVWDGKAVEKAIEKAKDKDKTPESVFRRRERAGYERSRSDMIQLVMYRGPLSGLDDSRDWWVGVVNEEFVVREGQNPFSHNMKPFRVAHYIEQELEPYGYGIGRIGRISQKQLDATRNLTMDTIIMSLFNMKVVSTGSGLKGDTLKFRPMGLVHADNPQGINNLSPDLNAAQAGMKLDEILKDEFRAATGATPNLQAIVQDVTATEAGIAQAEAIRRIAVYAEAIGEEFVRKHLFIMHRNNIDLLDQSMWLTVSGEEKPRFIDPQLINMDVDFHIKTTTDKDFRPNRVAQLLQWLQIETSVRQNFPDAQKANTMPIRKDLARLFGLRPGDIFPQDEMPLLQQLIAQEVQRQQQPLVQRMEQGMDRAQDLPQELGGDLPPTNDTPIPTEQEPIFGVIP